MRDIVKGLFLVLVVGCQTVPEDTEPVKCATLRCLMDEAREEVRRSCIRTLQRETLNRSPFKSVWPYDNPQWQHDVCRKYALLKVPR